MSTTLCIVEVPAASEQGKSSLASRRFANSTLLEWVVRRVTESLLVEQVAVISESPQLESLRRVLPPNVWVSTEAHADHLERLAASARAADASTVVRVSIDRPFVDPSLIDRLVCDANAHPGVDYVGYVLEDGRSALQARLGVFAELYRSDAIFRADCLAETAADRADLTRFICSQPDSFRLRLLRAPASLDRPDIRLSIDGDEDWEHANLIFEALGPERLDWQEIAQLLADQPALRERMAVLNDAH